MKAIHYFLFLIIPFFMHFESNCQKAVSKKENDFRYVTEQFADLRILRYQVPGFDQLSLSQKEFAYYLYEAAMWGREIIYDQNCKYNLTVKRTLEEIIGHYQGNRNSPEFEQFIIYTKRIWFSNGIHHHYSSNKILPDFKSEYFAALIQNSPDANFPLLENEIIEDFTKRLSEIIFNPEIAPKGVSQNPQTDMITNSSMNYYQGLTQREVEDFYSNKIDKNNLNPVMFGLNSRLEKMNGKVQENIYNENGLYNEAIKKIVFWLNKAAPLSETELQRSTIEKLIEFYKTGDLKLFDDYSILWTRDTEPIIDFVNGFIEVYGDPLGYRGAWQSVISIKDLETTKQYAVIGEQAGWFEKNSPIMEIYKRQDPKGVSYKVVNVISEAGDNAPSTPIGVNLPNSNWIRAKYGSKSVSLGNIENAYEEASKSSGMLEEFHTPEQIERLKKFGSIASKLHTGLHEVIGHGSGKIKEGIGTPKETLKNYASTLEEVRADLVALYYIPDPYLVTIGVSPSVEVGKAEYDNYIVNGLMKQLVRIKEGDQIEQTHMRNRALICNWVFEQGKDHNLIEKKIINRNTYFVINNYEKLRALFGNLLREIQRIKSEGDYEAGMKLVESYGVKIDLTLHKEVLKRKEKLGIAPYAGFIQPILKPVYTDGKISNIEIEIPIDFQSQMLYYSNHYKILPTIN